MQIIYSSMLAMYFLKKTAILNKMYSSLGIETLIIDVEDASQRIKSNEREADERREKITNTILVFLGFLVIGSALVDISAFFDRINIQAGVSTIISFGIVIATVVAAVVVCLKKYRRK